jgi:hypothetical protein
MKAFEDYINSLHLEPAYKKKVVAPQQYEGHLFYNRLAENLSSVFPSIEPALLKSFSESSYFYFQFFVLFDHILDCHRSQSLSDLTMGGQANPIVLEDFLLSMSLHEKAMVDLGRIFDADSPFWSRFGELKSAYFRTMMLEQKLSSLQSAISEADFRTIAIGKTVVSTAIAHGLSLLSGSDTNRDAVIELLNFTHVAVQYADDVDDFEEDIQEGQWTYARSLVRDFLRDKQIDLKELTPQVQYKYLFLSGIAVQMLEKSVFYFDQAARMATQLKLPLIQQVLSGKKNYIRSKIDRINDTVNRAKVAVLQ